VLVIKRDRRTAVPQAADLIFATGFGTFRPWPGHLAMTKRKSSEDRDSRPERSGETDVPDGGSQGILRDQRGQEQPADKERAQRTSKAGKG